MSAQILSERFEMRLGTSVLQDVDEWRARQTDLPSRAEAVRRLIEVGLRATSRSEREVRFTDGEKLILLTLRDLFKQLDLEPEESDLDFVAEAIFGGHSWGLKWHFSAVFHDHEDSKAVVSEVVNILDMWNFLESGFETLSKDEKTRVATECAPIGKSVRFIGFDGNNESEYIGVARFLIEQLKRFTVFEGRELNAHMPTIDAYRRMLSIFEGYRSTLAGRELNVDEIISLLRAKRHASTHA